MSSLALPVIDLDLFLEDSTSTAAIAEARKLLEAFIEFGAFILKDSRASEAANDRFLDVMEDYFHQPQELLVKDTRPEFGYQVGTTLENTERPSCHSSASCQAIIQSLAPEERPISTEGSDPKCRFFWRMGATPESTAFPTLAMDNVVPSAFAETWENDMDSWGSQIKSSAEGVMRMLSIGLGLKEGALLECSQFGPHLLGPTSIDLSQSGQVGNIFAGFHTDLNFISLHGASRYPGLHIWARNSGKKLTCPISKGGLLVQAGKQLEHLLNGVVLAGYHEVVCTKETMDAMKLRSSSRPDRPLIRISSTFFYHLSSDYELDPLAFAERINLDYPREEHERKYEIMKVGTLVQNELRGIELLS